MDLLDRLPARYYAFVLCIALFVLGLTLIAPVPQAGIPLAIIFGFLSALGVYDLRQPHRAILHNYPVLAHIRFLMETIRPEIRQYLLESDTDPIPFSRAQRSLVYQRAKNVVDVRP
ncbi:MAG TPA: hypothetical protein VFQ88_03965, partial [Nevskiaceae bacterium]|nr:hypothetical protein [Nevskiaceae bacterium]